MRVAEKLDWKGLKIKKSVGNRKIIMSDEVRHRIRKGYAQDIVNPWVPPSRGPTEQKGGWAPAPSLRSGEKSLPSAGNYNAITPFHSPNTGQTTVIPKLPTLRLINTTNTMCDF
jgi:hypothetical protein